MKLSILALSIATIPVLLLTSQTTHAQSYQSFSSLGYSQTDFKYNDRKSLGLSGRYYFDARETLGPLKEFDYINTISNISLGYNYSTSAYDGRIEGDGYIVPPYSYNFETKSHSVSVRGDWFVGNFLLGGGYSHIDRNKSDTRYYEAEQKTETDSYDDSNNRYNLSLGYLITDNFLIKTDFFESGDVFKFTASYNLELGASDYIGFSYNTDEELDFHHLSTKYFVSLSEQSYLVLGGSYMYDNTDSRWSDDHWSVSGEYYFNQNSSISAFYGEDDFYSVRASHFFNDHVSMNVSYTSNNSSEYEADGYSVSFVAQF